MSTPTVQWSHNAKSILYTRDRTTTTPKPLGESWRNIKNDCLLLQNIGADFIVIYTNTMHKLLPKIEPHIDIPFLHIAKATTNEI